MPISPQKAEVNFEVKAENHAESELTVQLREWKPGFRRNPPILEDGFLHLQRVCPTAIREGWIDVSAWGPTRPNLRTLGRRSCTEEGTWTVAEGTYTVLAYQAEFFGRERGAKILAVLKQHGKHVIVRKAGRSYLSVPVWTTDEIIRWALTSLRQGR